MGRILINLTSSKIGRVFFWQRGQNRKKNSKRLKKRPDPINFHKTCFYQTKFFMQFLPIFNFSFFVSIEIEYQIKLGLIVAPRVDPEIKPCELL